MVQEEWRQGSSVRLSPSTFLRQQCRRSSLPAELLFLYLPLPAVSRIFLGSLHTDYVVQYVEALPDQYRDKITLVETVTVAPKVQKLINDKLFFSTTALSRLFGDVGGFETGMEYLRDDSSASSSVEDENGFEPSEAKSSVSSPSSVFFAFTDTSFYRTCPPLLRQRPPLSLRDASSAKPSLLDLLLPNFLPPHLRLLLHSLSRLRSLR
jgi:hypothetical protein